MAIVNLSEAIMTAGEAQEILHALQVKGVNKPCPRCGNTQFTLLEGFFNQPLAADLSAASGVMAFSHGPTVPSVVTACTNCGFLSQHALGVLGLTSTPSVPAMAQAPRFGSQNRSTY